MTTPVSSVTTRVPQVAERGVHVEAKSEPRQEAAAAPSLWDLLTPEERDFFMQNESMGSLTYKPNGAAATKPQAPTGRRLDVRG